MEVSNPKYGIKVKVIDERVKVPPASIQVNKGDIITIFGSDGMYCFGKDDNGNRIYIACWTEVEQIVTNK